MWRAYIAQHKYRVVLDGIQESSPSIALQSIRKVAEHFAAIPSSDKRSAIVKYFDENRSCIDTNGNDDADDPEIVYSKIIWCLSAATVYYNETLYENALNIVDAAIQISPDLECLAMQLQCHLKINRLDLGRATLAKMQEKDDDATLTQLCSAWINIEQGGEKAQDAYYIFQDFCDRFVDTSLLLNGQAVCLIAQEKYEEADVALRKSLDKDPNNLDTFIDLIALTQQYNKTGKSTEDVVNRYLSQIKDSHPNCQLILDLDRKEQEFERLCARYGPSNQIET